MPTKKPEEYFPELNIHILEIQAERWVKKFSEAPIKRIVLYNFSSKYEAIMIARYDFQPLPIIYAVVFEVDEDDKTMNMTPEEHMHYDLAGVRGDRPQESYERLLAATKPNKRISDNEQYYELMTQDFIKVYKQTPNWNYRAQWQFYIEFNNDSLNANVRTDEPHIVLYQAAKEKESTIPKKHPASISREAKRNCRQIAAQILKEKPGIMTIDEAIWDDRMTQAATKDNGEMYTPKTIRDWIKDLFPEEARKPGRRPKK